MNSALFYFLKKNLPKSVKLWAKTLQKKRRERKIQSYKYADKKITADLLLHQLQNIGIKNGDSLLVHSSLSRIGFVENGPETVLDALTAAIGTDGTLLLPTYPFSTDVKSYVDSAPVFDVKNTPSQMGKITEVFRQRENVLRSLHPTHSVAASGPMAAYYVNDHFGQPTPFNEHSPFMKLVKTKGKILMLGVSLDSLTNFHTLEDAVIDFPYPVYCSEIYSMKVIDIDGTEYTAQTKVHNPEMSVKRRCNDFFDLFSKENVIKFGTIGIKECYILDAERLHDCMVRNYQEGKITMYTPNGN